jgi:hypothetical protein
VSAVPLRRPKADDEALALLREIRDLLKTLFKSSSLMWSA